jgi:predicted transcriptional regulator
VNDLELAVLVSIVQAERPVTIDWVSRAIEYPVASISDAVRELSRCRYISTRSIEHHDGRSEQRLIVLRAKSAGREYLTRRRARVPR